MRRIRASEERGKADHGWLKSYHSFSFADYYERQHMGFRSLRVINEDYIEPGKGFGTHPHRDMEILTYVIEGQLAHRDSMGNGRTINAGELQAMSAGSGITHSEYNPQPGQAVHLLQIWILPDETNLTPSYAEWLPTAEPASGGLTLLASPGAENGAVKIHQDVRVYLGMLEKGSSLEYKSGVDRHVWIQVVNGELLLGSDRLQAGDGVAISEEPALQIASPGESRFLLFDLN